MPTLDKRLTDSMARAIPLPSSGEVLHWCPRTPGFGLRVSHTGVKAYVLERRVDGKTTRRTLGKATGAGAISADAARALQLTVSSELQQGVDRAATRREQRHEVKRDALTCAVALREYVTGKRRKKDGLALKARTQADYIAMIEPGGTAKDGKPFADGLLYSIADKPAHRITAKDIRTIHAAAAGRGVRQQTYSMQVLRAVLAWHGIVVADSPIGRGTAGKDQIAMPPTKGAPRPIPPEKLGAWWRAASDMTGHPGADGLRFMLLTGCRPGEVFGDVYENTGLTVADVDMAGARAMLHDTKNRRDHAIMLSTQALELVKLHIVGKAPGQRVFDISYPRKALLKINAAAGCPDAAPHKLRHTFASVAAERVSAFALRAMVNHAGGGDVTGAHYVSTGDAQLRAAWQSVADHITGAPVASGTVVDTVPGP